MTTSASLNISNVTQLSDYRYGFDVTIWLSDVDFMTIRRCQFVIQRSGTVSCYGPTWFSGPERVELVELPGWLRSHLGTLVKTQLEVSAASAIETVRTRLEVSAASVIEAVQ